jgi:DnaJ homolog subfamily C member 9
MDELPTTSRYQGRCFYSVLGVPRSATTKEIQRAYRVLALKIHPDKNGNDPQCCRDFQELGRIVEVLTNPTKRAYYDEHGDKSDDEEVPLDGGYEIFRRVTKADIVEFAHKYRDSEEEKADVLHFYDRFHGDLCKMLAWIPLSTPDDIPRYAKMLEGRGSRAVRAAFTKSVAKAQREHARYAAEAKEAEEYRQELEGRNGVAPPPSSGGLYAMIGRKQLQQHQQLIRRLETKYAAPKKRRRKEPTEAEFAAIQARLIAGKRT